MSRRIRASVPPPAPTAAPANIVQRVDPEAWGLARLYANGDTRRLQVLDERTVLVRNS